MRRSLTSSDEEIEQTKRALKRLRPSDSPRNWSTRVHALSLWSDPSAPALGGECAKTLAIVFDTAKAADLYPGAPIYRVTRFGIMLDRADPKVEGFGDSHPDYTLSLLARLGVESDRRVLIRGKPYSVAQMVRGSVAEFSFENDLEWTAIAYALYLPPTRSWTNKYGEVCDFDRLCEFLCTLPPFGRSCYGTHVVQALAVLYGVDAQQGMLGERTRGLLEEKIRGVVERLQGVQRPNGSWDIDWCGPGDWGKGEASTSPDIVVTGHLLEFLAMVAEHVPVDESMVRHARRFLAERLLAETDANITTHYGTLAHCGVALKSWCPEAWDHVLAEEKGRVVEPGRSNK